MRDSMIIYRSFYEAISELPKENQADMWTAIFEYSLNFNKVELQGLSKTIFMLIEPILKANIKRYENGSKPKDKQSGSKPKANNKQSGSKSGTNKDVDNEVDKNEDKKLEKELRLSLFEKFWNAYGKKEGRKDAVRLWDKIEIDLLPEIITRAGQYKNTITNIQYQQLPATWLNGRRWEDEPASAPKAGEYKYTYRDFNNWPEWIDYANKNNLEHGNYLEINL